MKIKLLFGVSLFCFLGLSSCIKDEPLGREADIEDFFIEGDGYVTRSIIENEVQLVVLTSEDYSKLIPVIRTSFGATVEPQSYIPQDFSDGKEVIYTITSENKEYSKKYKVSVTPNVNFKFDFEEWTTSGVGKAKHFILKDLLWSNANSGIGLLAIMNAVKLDYYPTDKTTDCVAGQYAAILRTLAGPEKPIFGNYIPIMAGSLFRGSFKADMNDPLKSLHLGQVHSEESGKPALFKGYYKYTVGEVFTGRDGKPIDGRTDEFSMYAAIFKVEKGTPITDDYLDGRTIFTSERVVGMAEWTPLNKNKTDKPADNDFIKFAIPFKYKEELNFDDYDYRLTIVFASSKDGNSYEGAVGSTLIIDEVEIECLK